MFMSIFVPTFLKTLAIVCGIGGGVLAVLAATGIFLVVTYPITERFVK